MKKKKIDLYSIIYEKNNEWKFGEISLNKILINTIYKRVYFNHKIWGLGIGDDFRILFSFLKSVIIFIILIIACGLNQEFILNLIEYYKNF